MTGRRRSAWLFAITVAACSDLKPGPPPPLQPLPVTSGANAIAVPRVNGNVGTPKAAPAPELSYGTAPPSGVAAAPGTGGGVQDISLDFADTDIREVVAHILGMILKVNYTIDPGIHGTATFHTTQPLSRAQVLPTLEVLLAENGAALQVTDGLYRVVPSAAASGAANTTAVPLRYTSADTLMKVLQPFVGSGKLAVDPGRNALLISGDPNTTAALVSLVRSFDTDLLANQSYVLLPAVGGSAKDFASSMQDAFRGQSGGALANVVRVLPMDRADAVLVVTSEPRYLDEARRVYALLQRNRNQTVRSWHVYYLQNSHAEDMAYVLQQAFTPNNVTAQPTQPANTGSGMQTLNAFNTNATGGAAAGGTLAGAASTGQSQAMPGGLLSGGAPASAGAALQAAPGVAQQPNIAATGNPLLGGLDQTGQGANPDTMRIIPNDQNNAVLIYATPREEGTVEAMLHKIDILPLQVRIDAVIAEVRLNDALKYGTQFFFKAGGVNGILSNAAQSLSTSNLSAATFDTGFPGFVIGGSSLAGAPLAISALQQVTSVQVLSSPEVMVLDNQPARLQVGDLVPYLTGSTNVLTANTAIVNTINYRETGVIMQVTPRVNSGGQVTLDIAQEVSAVNTAAPTTPGISSPTFSDRTITSRVVVQDGETVGLAGLISDSVTRGNQGIPWLKDIPVLGFLAGSQDNERTRTELLVLITPHVIKDQHDARALTEDMRQQMFNAALVPQETQSLGASGSPDPGRKVRSRLKLGE